MRSETGFTVIELMIVVAIVAILAMIAGPSFREVAATASVKTAASDLQMTFVRARSEAMKRNADITVSSVSGDWSQGWAIQDGLEVHGTVQAVINGSAASLTYRPNGRTSAGALTFDVSSPYTQTKRCLSIGLNGQPAILQKACGS